MDGAVFSMKWKSSPKSKIILGDTIDHSVPGHTQEMYKDRAVDPIMRS
jgi:hypothetical protein